MVLDADGQRVITRWPAYTPPRPTERVALTDALAVPAPIAEEEWAAAAADEEAAERAALIAEQQDEENLQKALAASRAEAPPTTPTTPTPPSTPSPTDPKKSKKPMPMCRYGRKCSKPWCKFTHPAPSPPSAAPASSTAPPPRALECAVCLEREVDHLALPCGHANYCGQCAEKLNACSICGQKKVTFVRFYL